MKCSMLSAVLLVECSMSHSSWSISVRNILEASIPVGEQHISLEYKEIKNISMTTGI